MTTGHCRTVAEVFLQFLEGGVEVGGGEVELAARGEAELIREPRDRCVADLLLGPAPRLELRLGAGVRRRCERELLELQERRVGANEDGGESGELPEPERSDILLHQLIVRCSHEASEQVTRCLSITCHKLKLQFRMNHFDAFEQEM